MWWLILLGIFGCFAGVVLVGAPYLPTLSPQIATALELTKLRPGQRLLELGCGDGRVVVAAAKAGYQVVGYELNPLLAFVAWLRSRPYREHVTIVWSNYWRRDWPEADAIFVFLLPRYMTKLDDKIKAQGEGPLKLVSFAFAIPGKRPAAKKDGVYLYHYRTLG